MNDQAAGKRLRRYVKEGMASAGIETFTELAEKSGVGRDTLQAWMRGARAPSSGAGHKIATVIGSSYVEMMRAWEGKGPDDAERIIEALEWAIQLVRSGQVPPKVQAEVDAARRSASRRRRRDDPPAAE